MTTPRWPPQARTGDASPASLVNEFRVTLATQGLLTVPDAMTTLFMLPGIPDTLEVHIWDNDAVITVTDEQGRDAREIFIAAGTSTSTLPRQRMLRARNNVPGAVARLQAIARWL